jgi:hypothetical protein
MFVRSMVNSVVLVPLRVMGIVMLGRGAYGGAGGRFPLGPMGMPVVGVHLW